MAVIDADLRDPHAILASPALRQAIDLDQPVCLILACVLHFLEPQDADAAVAELTATLASGSYLILSAGTSTGTSPALIDLLRTAYQDTTTVSDRNETEIAAWFAGLDVLPPGLTDVFAWRPDCLWYWPPSGARIIGGVARKPGKPPVA